MTAQALHIVPPQASNGGHAASRTCRCGPVLIGRDLETGADAWRHRIPGAQTAEPATIRQAGPGRPAGGEITADALLVAAIARSEWDERPPTYGRLAGDLDQSYSRTREAVIRHHGDLAGFVACFEKRRRQDSVA